MYSNLIFKFKVFQSEENDHDFDNVPSHLEDINGNTDLTDDNSDDDEKLSPERPDEEHLPFSICYPVDVTWQPVQILFNDSAHYKEQTCYLFLIKIKTVKI